MLRLLLHASASAPRSIIHADRASGFALPVRRRWRAAAGVERRWTTRPRHCRVPPSSTRRAKTEAFPSSSRRGGAQRRGGGVEAPQDHPSATLSRPALLDEEGKV